LPLVAGLFVLVEALDRSGVLNALAMFCKRRPNVARWRPLGEQE
jgi:Na+/H+ antiporter NhaD/arsenite permease-like protein